MDEQDYPCNENSKKSAGEKKPRRDLRNYLGELLDEIYDYKHREARANEFE